MKNGFWAALVLLLALSGCAAQENGGVSALEPLPWPKEAVTLFVSSDLHWHNAGAVGANALIQQMTYLEEIIDTLLDETLRAQPAALILCGDLTNGGNLEEHRALAKRLDEAAAEGLRIFITMGNHDMDRRVEPSELMEIYDGLGFAASFSQDKDSMSYLAELNEEVWLLSLDCNVYGGKESESAGTISDETLAWVKDCLDRAAEAGALVVPFSHHNLLVHTLDGKGRNYNIDRGEELADLLLDYGVPLYLSGHRHNSFIVPLERNGRRLDEVVTDMPEAYPNRYTTLTIRPDGTVDYAVPGLDVEGWAARTGRTEPDLLQFSAYSQAIARERMTDSAANIAAALAPDEMTRNDLARFYIDFYSNYQNRTLWREGDRLSADPALSLWKTCGSQSIYARWMPWILENQTNDASEQILGPYR